jgi:hypothetical protein
MSEILTAMLRGMLAVVFSPWVIPVSVPLIVAWVAALAAQPCPNDCDPETWDNGLATVSE